MRSTDASQINKLLSHFHVSTVVLEFIMRAFRINRVGSTLILNSEFIRLIIDY